MPIADVDLGAARPGLELAQRPLHEYDFFAPSGLKTALADLRRSGYLASVNVLEERVMRSKSVKDTLDGLGNTLVSAFQMIALFVIGATIVWSAGSDYLKMVRAGRAGLDDILLLFIYLELGTIVGIYFKTDRLPVLFLLYVAITALTRFLAVDVKDLSIESVLAVTGSILVLTLAALVVQIAASRFATPIEDERSRSTVDASKPKAAGAA